MRKWIVLCLVMLSLCTLVFGNAEQVLPENKKDFSDLLSCLLSAVETPEKWSEPQLDAILLRIRNGSEEDTYLAESITSVWKKLYIDPGYELNLYPATDAGKALSEGGVSDTPTHAFAVLGYALENGKMTAELMGRCDAAAAAARAFPQTRLICSGGATGANNPKHHTEAGRMKEYLTEVCGIAPERILVDESAMTTAENAMNTYAMERLLGKADEIVHEDCPFADDTIEAKVDVYYDILKQPVVEVDVDTSEGRDFVFGVTCDKPGWYRVKMTGSSPLGALAQIPMTVYYTSIPIRVFTWNGTEGRDVTKDETLLFLSKYTIFRAHFGANGFRLKRLEFEFEHAVEEDDLSEF